MKKAFLFLLTMGGLGLVSLALFLVVNNFSTQPGTIQVTILPRYTPSFLPISQPTGPSATQMVAPTEATPTKVQPATPPFFANIAPPTNVFPHTSAIGAMTYDRERGEAVLFGGQQLWKCDFCDETWVWDASAWQLMTPINKPQGRMSFGFAYDGARKVSVLFGGQIVKSGGAQVPMEDTWAWNGMNWVAQYTSKTPGISLRPLMVYDAGRKNLLLYGGVQPQGRALDPSTRTWLWNGTDWEERKPTVNPGPATLQSAGIAYDAARQAVVIWNGSTWTWDGSNWQKKSPSQSPSMMNGMVMGYDEAHQQIVLVGKTVTSQPGQEKTETWVWDGVNWTAILENFPVEGASGENMIYDSKQGLLIIFTLSGDKFGGKTRTALAWTGRTWVNLYEAPADPIGERPTSQP